MDILQDYLSFRGNFDFVAEKERFHGRCELFTGFTDERLDGSADGSVRGEERFAAVKSFNEKTSDTFAFLLSTKAGGRTIFSDMTLCLLATCKSGCGTELCARGFGQFATRQFAT